MNTLLTFTLTPRLVALTKQKGGSLVCGRCDEDLKVYDRIVTFRHGGSKAKRRHHDCAVKSNIWEEDEFSI